MKNSYRIVLRYFLFLITLLSIEFSVHVAIRNYLNLALLDHLIVPAYLFNIIYSTTLLFFIVRSFLQNSDKMGSIFLAGSLGKMILFILFFYPSYSLYGGLEYNEMLSFFAPYITSLIMTTVMFLRFTKDQG